MEEKIKQIISEQLGVKLYEVLPNADLMQDLGADSLDLVELTMELEDKFGIEIPDEEAEKLNTVNEIIEYIKTKYVEPKGA